MRVAKAVVALMAQTLRLALALALSMHAASGAGFQIKVTSPKVRAGEPQLAVDPKNADNIVFFAMTATRPFVPLGKGRWWAQKGFLDCQISVSFDRGRYVDGPGQSVHDWATDALR